MNCSKKRKASAVARTQNGKLKTTFTRQKAPCCLAELTPPFGSLSLSLSLVTFPAFLWFRSHQQRMSQTYTHTSCTSCRCILASGRSSSKLHLQPLLLTSITSFYTMRCCICRQMPKTIRRPYFVLSLDFMSLTVLVLNKLYA